jgi:hypothetical protein
MNDLTEVYPVLHVPLDTRNGKLADIRIILNSSKYPTDNHQSGLKTATMKYINFVMMKEDGFFVKCKPITF